jgi:uncharacterized tellurite resistance protein B-like protein
MLKKILSLLVPAETTPNPDRIPLAAAVLLLEIAHADGDFSADEEKLIQEVLQQRFALDTEMCKELLQLAEDAKKHSSDLHQFTSLVNRNFSQPEKEAIIESFWHLAFADGRLDAHEEAMLRQLGTLIGLSHRQYIDAKIKVRNELSVKNSR